jgi:hypothetical protein
MNPTDHSTVHTPTAGSSIASSLTTLNSAFDLQPMIVAGDPAGDPPDSPDDRIDPNSPTSAFAGVGSIGGGGNDRLSGGSGADRLAGNAGDDVLVGGMAQMS